MTDIIIKIKLIYLQFLLVAIGFLAIYSFIIWLVMYQFSLVALNEDLVIFGLPFCLPAIPVYIWLYPRIKLLILKDKRGNLPFLYFFAASMAISVPAIIIQDYLLTAAGKLTLVRNVGEIQKKPVTKYYKIADHYIDKQHPLIHRRTEVSGKNNEYLTFHIYVVCPILPGTPSIVSTGSTPVNTPVVWLGKEYKKEISNHSSDNEKEQAFKDLGIETNEKFNTENLNDFIYLDHIGNNERHKGYKTAVKSNPQYQDSEPFILEAKNEPFEARNGNKLGWIFKSFGIGAGILLIMIIIPGIDQARLKKLPKNNRQSSLNAFLKLMMSYRLGGKSPIYVFLIASNILVFACMVFAGLGFVSFDGQDLYAWGANYRPAVLNGQWWRLLTNVFLHGGLMHLLFNMYGLFFVSIFLEPVIGKVKFLMAYLICGILASIASIWWHPATLSIGASGAIFGLYGVLTALLTTKKADASLKRGLLINNVLFIAINLLIGFTGGIDNAAHIGGLLTGIIIGYILYFFIDTPKPKRIYKKKLKVDNDESALSNNHPDQ